jgi:hypothetical protein
MMALLPSNIIPYADYERQREAFRARIIELAKRCRIQWAADHPGI